MSRRQKIGWMLAIPVVLLLLFTVPASRNWLLDVVQIFGEMDPQQFAEYIRSYGVWSVVISFLLMVIQSLAAPLPSFLLTFANAAVYGWVWGGLLSWTSAMVGAALCFGIARLYGRDAVAKLTGNTTLQQIDRFFAKKGTYAILIARLLPFMPFDVVSYGAGLTSMRFGAFLLATGIGQLPATIIYSYVGEMLVGGAQMFVYALLIIFALTAFIALLRRK